MQVEKIKFYKNVHGKFKTWLQHFFNLVWLKFKASELSANCWAFFSNFSNILNFKKLVTSSSLSCEFLCRFQSSLLSLKLLMLLMQSFISHSTPFLLNHSRKSCKNKTFNLLANDMKSAATFALLMIHSPTARKVFYPR